MGWLDSTTEALPLGVLGRLGIFGVVVGGVQLLLLGQVRPRSRSLHWLPPSNRNWLHIGALNLWERFHRTEAPVCLRQHDDRSGAEHSRKGCEENANDAEHGRSWIPAWKTADYPNPFSEENSYQIELALF